MKYKNQPGCYRNVRTADAGTALKRTPLNRKFWVLLIVPVLFQLSVALAQSDCNCSTRSGRRSYIDSVKYTLENICDSCELNKDEDLFVYDAKCKKFLGGKMSNLKVIEDIDDFYLRYKKPFRIRIINFNRYLYNLSIGNSDVTFTSSESQVMQQYLLPGTGNGLIVPPNTFTNSGSQNGADYVFSTIADFNVNIDKIQTEIRKMQAKYGHSLQLYRAAQQSISRMQELIDTRMGLNSNLSKKLRSIKVLDSLGSYQVTTTTAYTDLINSSNTIFNDSEIRTAVSRSKDLSSLLTASRKDVQKMNDSLSKYKIDSALQVLSREGYELKSRLNKLKKFCTDLIDNRITAYSICTTDFDCCEDPGHRLVYSGFDSSVTAISDQLSAVSEAYGAVEAALERKKFIDDSIAMAKQKKPGKAAGKEKVRPLVLDIKAADIVFDKQRVTGLTLRQIPEPESQPKEPEKIDMIKNISDLWFAFEKTIPADYIMRQVLFRRNLIRSHMSYTSPPIFPYGNRLGLTIQISASDSVKRMGIMPTNTEKIVLDFEVRGRPIFSFSAGTFAGFGLSSPTYEWQQLPAAGTNVVQPNSLYKLAKTSNGSLPVGITGLANVVWRLPGEHSGIYLGASGGVAVIVEPTPVRIGYLAGLAASLGTYQQFHFTFAPIAMNVNHLKSDLKTDVLYNTPPVGDLNTQKLKWGFAIAVSYTLFTPKGTGEQMSAINTNGSSK